MCVCVWFDSYDEAAAFAEKENLIFLETSAKNSDNVDEAFQKSAESVYKLIMAGQIDPKNEVDYRRKVVCYAVRNYLLVKLDKMF